MRRLSELLFLQPGELGRAWPFFALYLLLFAAFALADGLSLALFVERAGARRLPLAYGVTALANLALIAGYLLLAERVGAARLFQGLLVATAAVYAAAWLALRARAGGPLWYGALFVTREVSFALALMHFGTYLQDYFTRDQLNRVLPVVYAGGRVGGIVGGAMLEWLIGPLRANDLLPVFCAMCLAGAAAVAAISRAVRPAASPQDDQSDPGAVPPESPELEEQAKSSVGGFLRFARSSPLLFWASVSSVVFMVARWCLNYRYSTFFEAHFDGSAALAEFLGRYTQIALIASLAVQLLLVNRLVARFGVGAAYLGYGALVFVGAALTVPEMTLAVALFARFLETELRLGLRNPLMQLVSNKFSKPLRLRVRAWTMGLLTPLGTGLASALLALPGLLGAGALAGWVSGTAGLAFLLTALGLWGALREERPDNAAPGGGGPPETQPACSAGASAAPNAR